MAIDALAKEKIELQLRLQGIAMTNVYGLSFDGRVALEQDRIEALKRLNEVCRMIDDYEGGRIYRNEALHP